MQVCTEIYSDSNRFTWAYDGKRLLHDSVCRISEGYGSIKEGMVLKGVGNILTGWVEAIVAPIFVGLSLTFELLMGIVFDACALLPAIVLNLTSRIPGISSFERVRNFTRNSNDFIDRVLRVHRIAFPAVFLFLTACCLNLFLPGILKPQNIFFSAIHQLVEPLGALKTKRVTVPGHNAIEGTEERLCVIGHAEEYLRALSIQNYLRDETASCVRHITITLQYQS